MLPLVLAWAITIHKSQGATLPRAVLNVGPVERQLGIFFVVISRVRSLLGLAFAHPVDAERLPKVANHAGMPFRKRAQGRLARLENDKLIPWLAEQLGVPPDNPVAEMRRLMLPLAESFSASPDEN